MSSGISATAIVLSSLTVANAGVFAKLQPATERAFAHYIALSEAQMQATGPFLWLDSHPAQREKVRHGEILIEPRRTLDLGKPVAIPHGQVQDWMGAVFLPGATLARVSQVKQDYDDYKNFDRPLVIESKLLSRNGDEFRVFLRLYRKQLITVVLDADYDIHYVRADAKQLLILSRSTRITEVKDAGRPNSDEPPYNRGYGLLWNLNFYWKFEKAPGGVFGECRAISLSRDIPRGLGWLLDGFVRKFPRDTMRNTLEGTRRAVSAH